MDSLTLDRHGNVNADVRVLIEKQALRSERNYAEVRVAEADNSLLDGMHNMALGP